MALHTYIPRRGLVACAMRHSKSATTVASAMQTAIKIETTLLPFFMVYLLLYPFVPILTIKAEALWFESQPPGFSRGEYVNDMYWKQSRSKFTEVKIRDAYFIENTVKHHS